MTPKKVYHLLHRLLISLWFNELRTFNSNNFSNNEPSMDFGIFLAYPMRMIKSYLFKIMKNVGQSLKVVFIIDREMKHVGTF